MANKAWVDNGGSVGCESPGTFPDYDLDAKDAGEPWPQPDTLPEMPPVVSGFFAIPAVEMYHPSRIPMPDPINHPPHYTFGKIEVITVIEDWGLSFHLAQVVKYVARSKHKGSELEDLRKAKWFLDRLITSLEPK